MGSRTCDLHVIRNVSSRIRRAPDVTMCSLLRIATMYVTFRMHGNRSLANETLTCSHNFMHVIRNQKLIHVCKGAIYELRHLTLAILRSATISLKNWRSFVTD